MRDAETEERKRAPREKAVPTERTLGRRVCSIELTESKPGRTTCSSEMMEAGR